MSRSGSLQLDALLVRPFASRLVLTGEGGVTELVHSSSLTPQPIRVGRDGERATVVVYDASGRRSARRIPAAWRAVRSRAERGLRDRDRLSGSRSARISSRPRRAHAVSDFRQSDAAGRGRLEHVSIPTMTFDERYGVIQSRDPRFDGQFVTAVSSTGIYCRPSCPARTPKPSNVSFFATSAAAHEAGYRACKRCLPEAAPGSPEWDLRGDTTARAMRLIADGVVEREGVPGLARRLGYSPRHLTRLLTAELGAGPLALSRAHRAHTARMLLVGTDLPAADVAFSAGFSSIRQFNETVREVFGMPPLELRARRRRGPGARRARRDRPRPAAPRSARRRWTVRVDGRPRRQRRRVRLRHIVRANTAAVGRPGVVRGAPRRGRSRAPACPTHTPRRPVDARHAGASAVRPGCRPGRRR